MVLGGGAVSYDRGTPADHTKPNQTEVALDQVENNYFTETCSGSEAGSYVRLIDFVYHSTLGLRVIKKKKKKMQNHTKDKSNRIIPGQRQSARG